ncbi:MAG: hypothetical protein AAF585_22145, partial [Verrucomicrobiota bacterium]
GSMEPVSLIVGALIAGASKVAPEAVQDAYKGLKKLITDKYNRDKAPNLENAIRSIEQKPDSAGAKAMLEEEIPVAEILTDEDILKAAQVLMEKSGQAGGGVHIEQSGDGAIAMGDHSVAAGKGGIAIGGDVHGDVKGNG